MATRKKKASEPRQLIVNGLIFVLLLKLEQRSIVHE